MFSDWARARLARLRLFGRVVTVEAQATATAKELEDFKSALCYCADCSALMLGAKHATVAEVGERGKIVLCKWCAQKYRAIETLRKRKGA